jgi:hypothetical protein
MHQSPVFFKTHSKLDNCFFTDDSDHVFRNMANAESSSRPVPPVSVCAICLSVSQTPFTLACGHGFCGDHILTWLTINPTCPVCRWAIPTDQAHNNKYLTEAIARLLTWATSMGLTMSRAHEYLVEFMGMQGLSRSSTNSFVLPRLTAARLYHGFPDYVKSKLPAPGVVELTGDSP